MSVSDADFSESDREELEKLEKDVLDELDANQGEATPETEVTEQAPAQTEQQAAPAATQPAAPTAAAPAETPAPTETKGEPRAALRASRRAERRAQEEVARLKAENEALRQGKTVASGETDEDEVLATLEIDQPEVATVFKRLKEKVDRLEGSQAQREADPEFIPDSLPPELQDAVDEIPALLAMQNDPDQASWSLAKRTDALLTVHPKWANASQTDRLNEVARRVAAELGTQAQPTTVDHQARAREAIASAKSAGIGTLSDLRGGDDPGKQTPDYGRMSDEEVINSL